MGTRDTKSDWTSGPAKWFAVVLLGVLAATAFAWSAVRGRAGTAAAVGREPIPAPAAVGVGVAADTGVRADETVTSTSAKEVIPKTAGPLTSKVNINTAGEAELDLLPGVGPALAKRIIEYRTKFGAFTSVDQLDAVKGIGPKLLSRLREHVVIDAEPAGGNPVSERPRSK